MLFKDLGNMKNDSWGLNVDRLNETQIGPYIKLKSPPPPPPARSITPKLNLISVQISRNVAHVTNLEIPGRRMW